jgi:drug/metabolite transporter (DMT)-like permease
MWIPITLIAATLQIVRTSQQHRIRSVLPINAAGFVRYVYGAPLALIALTITAAASGWDLPSLSGSFWLKIAFAGVAQIIGTLALLRAFDLRDFAIGTVYSKTEVATVAIASTVLIDEPIALGGWLGIILCLAGVMWLAAPGRLDEVVSGVGDPAAWYGTLTGAMFALTSVAMRSASTALEGSTWTRSMITLTAMLVIQTAINGVHLVATDRTALVAVFRHWRPAGLVGVLSVSGSAAWAIAFTLTNAAKVRTVGQVELIIAFLLSALWLKERHHLGEYVASAVVVLGVAIVVVAG